MPQTAYAREPACAAQTGSAASLSLAWRALLASSGVCNRWPSSCKRSTSAAFVFKLAMSWCNCSSADARARSAIAGSASCLWRRHPQLEAASSKLPPGLCCHVSRSCWRGLLLSDTERLLELRPVAPSRGELLLQLEKLLIRGVELHCLCLRFLQVFRIALSGVCRQPFKLSTLPYSRFASARLRRRAKSQQTMG